MTRILPAPLRRPRTRPGLILRAVGENDQSAHSIGYSVIGVRYAAVAFGGAMAGIGGAAFPLVLTPLWAEGLTGGRGWIAIALVVLVVRVEDCAMWVHPDMSPADAIARVQLEVPELAAAMQRTRKLAKTLAGGQ